MGNFSNLFSLYMRETKRARQLDTPSLYKIIIKIKISAANYIRVNL